MKVITRSYPAEWDYINLYPISDTHIGAGEFMEKEFQRHIDLIKQDDRAVVVLAGDIINNGIKSSKTNVYTEIYPPGKQKKRAIELLRPISDKIITAVAGNHERRSTKECDIDITEDICDALGIEYGGDMVFVKLSLGKGKNGKPVTYMVGITHGAGGGGSLGGGVNKVDKFQIAVEGLDISISGHTHKPSKTHTARLVLDPQNNRVTTRNTLIFICTSWLRYDGYPTQGMLPPVAFQPDFIRLDGREKSWR